MHQGYTVFSIPVGIVYRPNEAKVKNLKTKDYLGKARLVAASDRANAFTGFAGSEIKKGAQVAKDDRPEEKLSFAATNLVKPELQSRARQQSEPPISRNMFPPTPPPESDSGKSRGSGGSSEAPAPMSRAQSVRGGGPKPQPLNLGRAAFDQTQPSEPPRRQGTQRSASERPPPSRAESQRSRNQRDYKPRRRGSDEDIIDDYYEGDEGYNPRGSRGAYTRSKQSRRPAYIEEEDEDDYDGSDLDDAEFEMVSRMKSRRRSAARSTRSGGSNRGVGSKIRVKVHAGDTRYVFINQETTMREFWQSIKEKFGVRNNFKVEFKDDGDMITMADQDDLDMAIQTARSLAKRENSDMAKLEVTLAPTSFIDASNILTHDRFGSEKLHRTRDTPASRIATTRFPFGWTHSRIRFTRTPISFLFSSISRSELFGFAPTVYLSLARALVGNFSEHFACTAPFTLVSLFHSRTVDLSIGAGGLAASMYVVRTNKM